MEIRTLRYFLAAAREENMTRAAETLHVTQPTLSKALKALEDELGKKLFTRHSFSIRLTDEGVLLRNRAEDLVSMADKIAREFAIWPARFILLNRLIPASAITSPAVIQSRSWKSWTRASWTLWSWSRRRTRESMNPWSSRKQTYGALSCRKTIRWQRKRPSASMT